MKEGRRDVREMILKKSGLGFFVCVCLFSCQYPKSNRDGDVMRWDKGEGGGGGGRGEGRGGEKNKKRS